MPSGVPIKIQMAEELVRLSIFTKHNAKQTELGKWGGDVDTSRICKYVISETLTILMIENLRMK